MFNSRYDEMFPEEKWKQVNILRWGVMYMKNKSDREACSMLLSNDPATIYCLWPLIRRLRKQFYKRVL